MAHIYFNKIYCAPYLAYSITRAIYHLSKTIQVLDDEKCCAKGYKSAHTDNTYVVFIILQVRVSQMIHDLLHAGYDVDFIIALVFYAHAKIDWPPSRLDKTRSNWFKH